LALRRAGDGEWKKDKRLKEKTVVPVVQAGKVEIPPKCFCPIDLSAGRFF
jgi:hypothetical protein